MRALAAVADLVLPAECAGCGRGRVPLRYGVCDACAGELEGLTPHAVRPDPAPAGLPPCAALGGYAGVLREVLLGYKERGRHGLAAPLGLLLADVVATAATATLGGNPNRNSGQAPPWSTRLLPGSDGDRAGNDGKGPFLARAARGVVLVPVPDTARAARARHGDHVWRLARHAAAGLRRAGWPAEVMRPVRALPRPDSAELDAVARAAAAAAGFRLRPGRVAAVRRAATGRTVVLVDDIVTTGATLAAIAGLLSAAGVPVDGAAVLGATQKRRRDPRNRYAV
ncbi:phosphoribosyltransferase family protein [Actinomycetes bacterium KLBMP 9797]